MTTVPTKPCTKCAGSTVYRDAECSFCNGAGTFAAPDVEGIIKALLVGGTLAKKKPLGAREGYVWRMARFDMGLDVTLPVLALLEIEGDPYEVYLTAMAGLIAVRLTGHGSAGAARWSGLIGTAVPPQPTMPSSAVAFGPVVLGSHDEDT